MTDLPEDLESALPPWKSCLVNILPQLAPAQAEELADATAAVMASPGKPQAARLLEAIYAAGSVAVYGAINNAVWLLSHLRTTAVWSVRDIAAHAIARYVNDNGLGRVACESGFVWIDQGLLLEPLLDLETDPAGAWIGQGDEPDFADIQASSNPRRAFVRALLQAWQVDPDASAWLHCRSRILAVPAVGIPTGLLNRTVAGAHLVRCVVDAVMRHPTAASANQRPWWTSGWSPGIADMAARQVDSGTTFRAQAPWLRSYTSSEQLEVGLFAFGPQRSPCANLAAVLRHRTEYHHGELLKDLGGGWMAYAWDATAGSPAELPILLRDDRLDSPLFPLAALVADLVADGTMPGNRTVTGAVTCSVHAALRGGLVHLALRDRLWLVSPNEASNPDGWYCTFAGDAPLPPGWSGVPDSTAWEAYVTPSGAEAA